MKHKYCFLRNHGSFKPDDVIYVVMVGSSVRESAKFSLVDEYCKDCGLYFHRWSSQVDSAISQAKRQYRSDGNVIAHPFRSAVVSISDLYRMIVDDSFDAYESTLVTSKFQLWMLFRHNPRYLQSFQRNDVIHRAYPDRRNNLSIGTRSQSQLAVDCVVGLFILLVFDLIVSNLMNW